MFAVKAPRLTTHYKKFNGTEGPLKDFYETIEQGLDDKLGCVLFQMPPQFSYTEERLEKVLAAMDTYFHNVVGFRHASWWHITGCMVPKRCINGDIKRRACKKKRACKK